MAICELCSREVSLTTRHHLIPRTRHKNKRNKKTFSRQDVRERLVTLCKPCHNNIHTVLTNKDLERDYNTLDALRQHPSIQQFCDWVRTKPDGTTVPSRRRRRRT